MTWKDGEFQPVQKRADSTKRKILEAALKSFSKHGYHGANTKVIAADAGVATGTVYRYYRDKKTIFMAVRSMLEDSMRVDIFGRGRKLLEQGGDLREILSGFTRYAVESHRENRMFFREVISLEAADCEVAEAGKKRDQQIRKQLQDFLSLVSDQLDVDDLEAAAELIHLVVEEVSHRAVIFESNVGEERLIGQMVLMLKRYLHI